MFNKENKEGGMVRTITNYLLHCLKLISWLSPGLFVHKIDEESPFWEKTKEEIIKQNPEFLIFVNGLMKFILKGQELENHMLLMILFGIKILPLILNH